jgi:hypothetical protein
MSTTKKKTPEQNKKIDTEAEFPRYLVIIGDAAKGQPLDKSFTTMGCAGRTYDSGLMMVAIGDDVLEQDFKLRPITEAERQKISNIAEDYSASK